MSWLLWGATVLVGLGSAAALAVLSDSRGNGVATGVPTPLVTWAAGARPAPAFVLDDQHGAPVALSALRGRPVIVTFIDPLCRNYCPREASVLSEAVTRVASAHPAIVAVSVDPWGDTSRNFHEDALHWRLAAGWTWAIGSETLLASVWRRYEIAVEVTKKTIAGITVRYITHTEAAYVIDGSGHERALLLWPFTTDQAVTAIHDALAPPS